MVRKGFVQQHKDQNRFVVLVVPQQVVEGSLEEHKRFDFVAVVCSHLGAA